MENKRIEIVVNLSRNYKANALRGDDENQVSTFRITDNGEGFTDSNFDKFTRSINKSNHTGGKGLGRIAYLKVFADVRIDSVYIQDGQLYRRQFSFNTASIEDKKVKAEASTPQTILTFKQMRPAYQKYTAKSIDDYADSVLEYFYVFLNYLHGQGKEFDIKFVDDSGKISSRQINNERLNQDKVSHEKFTIKDPTAIDGLFDDEKETFEIVHIKSKNIKGHKALYVVDERSAGEISNIELPPSGRPLEDQDGFTFYYYVYLQSDYFQSFLNDSRTLLSLPHKNHSTDDCDITEERIKDELQMRINHFLAYELNVLDQKNEEKVHEILTKVDNNKTYNNSAYLYLLGDEETKSHLLKTIKYSDSEKKILSKVRDFHEAVQAETVEQINQTMERLKNEKTEEIDFSKLGSALWYSDAKSNK
jgi:hypothetical protein